MQALVESRRSRSDVRGDEQSKLDSVPESPDPYRGRRLRPTNDKFNDDETTHRSNDKYSTTRRKKPTLRPTSPSVKAPGNDFINETKEENSTSQVASSLKETSPDSNAMMSTLSKLSSEVKEQIAVLLQNIAMQLLSAIIPNQILLGNLSNVFSIFKPDSSLMESLMDNPVINVVSKTYGISLKKAGSLLKGVAETTDVLVEGVTDINEKMQLLTEPIQSVPIIGPMIQGVTTAGRTFTGALYAGVADTIESAGEAMNQKGKEIQRTPKPSRRTVRKPLPNVTSFNGNENTGNSSPSTN